MLEWLIKNHDILQFGKHILSTVNIIQNSKRALHKLQKKFYTKIRPLFLMNT